MYGEGERRPPPEAARKAANDCEVMATMTGRDTTIVANQFDLIGKAAVMAGVTESQVRYWVRIGLLPTRTLGHRQRPLLVEVDAVIRLAREHRELA
jgi:MerR family regulatory protein